MGTIIRTYDDGRQAVAKTCRTAKTCSACGEDIPKGEGLIAIQSEANYGDKKYFKDEKWFHAGCDVEAGDPAKDLEELMDKIYDLFDDNKYMTGPTCWGPELRTAKNGQPHYQFGISVSAILDGTVYVFPTKFYVNWQRGRSLESADFNTFEELKNWVETNGWS